MGIFDVWIPFRRDANLKLFFVYCFGGLECVGHSFAYVAHLLFLRDVWIRTQSAAVASWRATDLATHPSNDLATHPIETYSRHSIHFLMSVWISVKMCAVFLFHSCDTVPFNAGN